MSAELLHANLSDLVTDVGEDRRDHGLQSLLLVTAGLILQETLLSTDDESFASSVSVLHHGILLVR